MSIDSPQVTALKERYRASFSEKRETVQQLRQLVEDGDELAEVKAELHKLAGSSGMYGYADIAAVCRQAMESVDAEQADAQKRATLAISLERLMDLLDHQE